jgi:hypothetical protein
MVTHVELGASFQARHIELELERATYLGTDATAARALAVLTGGGFDHAPIVDEGVVIGFGSRSALATVSGSTPIREAMTPLGDGNLVSSDTPIGDLLDLFADQPFLFVLDGGDITGFVTVTDLNKQPARAYLYLVLAGLEIALADLVRWRHGPDQRALLPLLGKRDQDSIKSRFRGDRGEDADADLVSYMGFKHLLRIFEKDRELRAELDRYSQKAWRSVTWPLSELRNDVMHPISSFVSTGEDVAQLARHVAQARVLVDQTVHALRRRYALPDPEA